MEGLPPKKGRGTGAEQRLGQADGRVQRAAGEGEVGDSPKGQGGPLGDGVGQIDVKPAALSRTGGVDQVPSMAIGRIGAAPAGDAAAGQSQPPGQQAGGQRDAHADAAAAAQHLAGGELQRAACFQIVPMTYRIACKGIGSFSGGGAGAGVGLDFRRCASQGPGRLLLHLQMIGEGTEVLQMDGHRLEGAGQNQHRVTDMVEQFGQQFRYGERVLQEGAQRLLRLGGKDKDQGFRVLAGGL